LNFREGVGLADRFGADLVGKLSAMFKTAEDYDH
jgi:hypothetical protein